jgi:hypothetical protein
MPTSIRARPDGEDNPHRARPSGSSASAAEAWVRPHATRRDGLEASLGPLTWATRPRTSDSSFGVRREYRLADKATPSLGDDVKDLLSPTDRPLPPRSVARSTLSFSERPSRAGAPVTDRALGL